MIKILSIFGDGGSRGNPGPAASAFVALEGDKVVSTGSLFLGKTTNNVAEYNCVLLALRWVLKFGQEYSEIQMNLDSQLVVRQLSGVYKIRNDQLTKLYLEVISLQKKIKKTVSYKYIPRKENKIADKLVNEELDKVDNI